MGSREIIDVDGRAALLVGIMGRKQGTVHPSEVVPQMPQVPVVATPREIEEGVELDDRLLDAEHLKTLDEALIDGFEICLEKLNSRSSILSVIIEDPEAPEIRYGGFGRTAESALRMATQRMIEERIGVSNPSRDVLAGLSRSFLTRVDRSPADLLVNKGVKVHVRKYSSAPEDKVTIAAGSRFYRGSTFSEAWGSIPQPEVPQHCGV